MEPIGLAASVLALTQAIGKIAKVIDKVGRAQEKWKQYHQELILTRTLVSTADTLWKAIEGSNTLTINVNGRQTSLIGYCTESINISILDAQSFVDKYKTKEDAKNSHPLRRVREGLRRIMNKSQMAYREDDVKDLMDRVVTAKSSLKMAMSIILLQKEHYGHIDTQNLIQEMKDEMGLKLERLQEDYEDNIQNFKSATIQILESADMIGRLSLVTTDVTRKEDTSNLHRHIDEQDHDHMPQSVLQETGKLHLNTRNPPDEHTTTLESRESQRTPSQSGEGAMESIDNLQLIPYTHEVPRNSHEGDLIPTKPHGTTSCDVEILFLNGELVKFPRSLSPVLIQSNEEIDKTEGPLLLDCIDSEKNMESQPTNGLAMTKWRPPGSPPSSAQQLFNFLRYNQEPTETEEESIKSDNEPAGGEDQTTEGYDKTTTNDHDSTKSITQATETDGDSTGSYEESTSSDERRTKSDVSDKEEVSDEEEVGGGQDEERFPSVPCFFCRKEASDPQPVDMERKRVLIQYGSYSYGYSCGRCKRVTWITGTCEFRLPKYRRRRSDEGFIFRTETVQQNSTCCVQ